MSKKNFVLETHERPRLSSLGIKNFMRSSLFKNKKLERAYGTLDQAVDRLQRHRAPDPLKPEVLAEILKAFLRTDPAVAGHFMDRGAKNMKDDEKREEIYDLLARAIVEKYLNERAPQAVEPGLAITDELIDDLEKLLDAAVEEAAISEQDAREAKANLWTLESSADVITAAKERLATLLLSDEGAARETDAEGTIPVGEEQRAIAKAALLQLRAKPLRSIASELGVTLVRDNETLIDLIIREVGYDREKIAELVVNAENPGVEVGAITRLVPLSEAPDLDTTAAQLQRFRGSYWRVGVAQWFVLESVQQSGTQLVATGRLRGYAVQAVEVLDEYDLNATPREAQITIRLRDRAPWAEINARRLSDLRASVQVLRRAAGIVSAGAIKFGSGIGEHEFMQWDRVTVWLLDFLNREFESADLSIVNFRMAHFETAGSQQDDPTVPAIRAVRLSGQHVASHREACQLIVDGRRLLDVEIVARYGTPPNDQVTVPVRLGLTPEHATINTGIDPEATGAQGDLHRLLVRKVRSALGRPLKKDTLLPRLEQIRSRARQSQPASTSDIFGPAASTTQSSQAAPAGH